MGCASSTPMIQTTGSEMLKAASHVAADATKTAEDTVEGIKDSVGKSLETAKDSVATTVESVKHEVENMVKEKTEMLGDATSSLMGKLHLKQTENEDSSTHDDKENVAKTETDEQKIQLSENSNTKQSNGENDAPAVDQTEAIKAIKEYDIIATDTETDSLKTSTPEPEIEQALAKSHNNPEDEDDNPPTPKPTLAELENLTAEFLQQRQPAHSTMMVNDIVMSNDPQMSPVMQENIKTLNGNNMMSLNADNSTLKDNEPTKMASANKNEIKSTNVHHAPQINLSPKPQAPLAPLTLATTAIATATAVAAAAATPTAQSKHFKERGKAKKSRVHKEDKVAKSKCEEKRPRTTEWEKYADMLAQVRKFNPHDAYRRGSTLSKFNGAGTGQLRERTFIGHPTRYGMDDDCSDTNSPQNSQRSSARLIGRVQLLPNRPTTGNNRISPQEPHSTRNGSVNNTNKTRRNSNINATTGRKFYFNPARSRVNASVSSTPLIQSALQNTVSTTPKPYAPYSHSYESGKSPVNMRSHHSRSELATLPPLKSQERSRSHAQQESMAQTAHHHHQHFKYDNASSAFADHNGNMATQNYLCNYDTPLVTRQSSITSLSSNSSFVVHTQTLKSSSNLDLRLQPTIQYPPVKNTSSFLTTPRVSPFGLTKSYTDLYFSATSNKENKAKKPFPVKSPISGINKKNHFIK